jgi:geranylgeranyl pyrophosphate synthase
LIFITACSPGAQIDSKDVKARIKEATDVFFGQSANKNTLVNSLIILINVVADLSSSSKYKDDIKYRIDVAKELIQNESLFNEKARQYLRFAYREITNGKKFQTPEELDVYVTPQEAQEKALKYSKELVKKALSELDSGHHEEAARLILELVLMIVTPQTG